LTISPCLKTGAGGIVVFAVPLRERCERIVADVMLFLFRRLQYMHLRPLDDTQDGIPGSRCSAARMGRGILVCAFVVSLLMITELPDVLFHW
jgi:hypothetical protein